MNLNLSSSKFNRLLKKAGFEKRVISGDECENDILDFMEHLLDRIKKLEDELDLRNS